MNEMICHFFRKCQPPGRIIFTRRGYADTGWSYQNNVVIGETVLEQTCMTYFNAKYYLTTGTVRKRARNIKLPFIIYKKSTNILCNSIRGTSITHNCTYKSLIVPNIISVSSNKFSDKHFKTVTIFTCEWRKNLHHSIHIYIAWKWYMKW